jgi:hypothetical protein
MPIEIREIVIRATIDGKSGGRAPAQPEVSSADLEKRIRRLLDREGAGRDRNEDELTRLRRTKFER